MEGNTFHQRPHARRKEFDEQRLVTEYGGRRFSGIVTGRRLTQVLLSQIAREGTQVLLSQTTREGTEVQVKQVAREGTQVPVRRNHFDGEEYQEEEEGFPKILQEES